MASAEEHYLGDLTTDEYDLNQFDIKDEDRESLITEDPIVICSGKKNIEQIDAYLNVLGTRIVYDVETAEGDEWFED